jgi:hypothetical protein
MKVRVVQRKKIRVSIKTSTLFKSLAENGIDFLKKSVADIKKSPKYSVINFCSAVEIFLKARLIREHWSLILVKPELADAIKFRAGDFISVSMEEAIRRLDNICNEKISLETREAFKATRNHRNKLVHFFHPGYANASRTNIEQIVAEVCRAWFYLHQLLTNQWSDHFGAYHEQVGKLDIKMHQLRQFLKAKFQALEPKIRIETASGYQFEKCEVCTFMAARIDEIWEPLYESKCKVCNAEKRFLFFDCPRCKQHISVEDMGEGECVKCRFEVDINYLLDTFGELQDPKELSTHAYCSECERMDTPTAVPYRDGYLCLSCLTEHDRADNCGFCNELCTGIDPIETSGFGCVVCEGSLSLEHT